MNTKTARLIVSFSAVLWGIAALGFLFCWLYIQDHYKTMLLVVPDGQTLELLIVGGIALGVITAPLVGGVVLAIWKGAKK